MKKLLKTISFCLTFLFMIEISTAQGWNIIGNSNVTNSNFIGTTNSIPLSFRTNNVLRMYLSPAYSFLGIGTDNPNGNLHIYSTYLSGRSYLNTIQLTNPTTGSLRTQGFIIAQSGKNIMLKQQSKGTFSITNNSEGMVIDTTGYIGFNTSLPKQKIHIVDNNLLISRTSSRAPGSRNGSLLFGSAVNDNCPYGEWGIEYMDTEANGYGLNFWKTYGCDTVAGFNYALFLSNNGNVGIGTGTPQARLSVNGNICAKEIRISLNGFPCWPDFVFDKAYNLMSIENLQQFIHLNKHLPDVPSSQDVENNGLNLGEMNATLLKKIEELTLYIIDLQNQIDDLKDNSK